MLVVECVVEVGYLAAEILPLPVDGLNFLEVLAEIVLYGADHLDERTVERVPQAGGGQGQAEHAGRGLPRYADVHVNQAVDSFARQRGGELRILQVNPGGDRRQQVNTLEPELAKPEADRLGGRTERLRDIDALDERAHSS